ncbi:MAG TPA: hypothetical protein PKK51_13035, partial [Rhodocyclaceae bacterium]|nr:hypothetical protein [Rhodocyclaceae bacterium]
RPLPPPASPAARDVRMSRSGLHLRAIGDLLRRTAAVFGHAWRTRQQLAAPHRLTHELMRC